MKIKGINYKQLDSTKVIVQNVPAYWKVLKYRNMNQTKFMVAAAMCIFVAISWLVVQGLIVYYSLARKSALLDYASSYLGFWCGGSLLLAGFATICMAEERTPILVTMATTATAITFFLTCASTALLVIETYRRDGFRSDFHIPFNAIEFLKLTPISHLVFCAATILLNLGLGLATWCVVSNEKPVPYVQS